MVKEAVNVVSSVTKNQIKAPFKGLFFLSLTNKYKEIVIDGSILLKGSFPF